MRAFFVGILFCLCTLLTPLQLHADDFRDGVRAYNKKNFSLALSLWLPLAEQDNALAQTLVGSMYAYGEGTGQDDVQAVKWFTRAANQGSVQAQYNLGIMYEQGFGVEKNLDEARRWLLAAAEQGREEARKRLDSLPDSPAPNTVTLPPMPDREAKTDALAESTERVKTSTTPVTSPVTKQAAISAPTKADAIPDSTEMPKTPPAPATSPVTEQAAISAPTKADTLPDTTEMPKTSTTPATNPVTEQVAISSPPMPDVEVEEDDFASTPSIHITLDTLLANIIIEPIPDSASDSGTEDDELSSTASITIRFDTLLAGKAPPTTDVEHIQSAKPEPAPKPDIETKTEELLGPPEIDVTSGTDVSLKWLQEQPADYYTIQLVSSVEKHLIDAHMKEIHLTGPLAQIMSKRDGHVWYAIIYGSFRNFDDAKRELDQLPANLHAWQPWIRQIDSINQFHKR